MYVGGIKRIGPHEVHLQECHCQRFGMAVAPGMLTPCFMASRDTRSENACGKHVCYLVGSAAHASGWCAGSKQSSCAPRVTLRVFIDSFDKFGRS